MGRRNRFRVAAAVVWAVFALSTAWPPEGARAYDGRPNLDVARAMFDRLATRDRNELYLMLIATGDFDAMASDQFGTRLYDAIASFQAKQGLEADGVVRPETFRRLSQVGGRIFNSWGFSFLDHPTAEASIVVPDRFGFTKSETSRGWALTDKRRTMSIDFAFFPEGEADLGTVFARLTEPRAGRSIRMKVIRDDFFVIAGSAGALDTYSRFIPVPGGIAGFTIAWSPVAYPNAGRIAVVMANELYPRRMAAGGDLFTETPGDKRPDPTPVGPLYTPSPAEQQRERERVAERERLLEEERLNQRKIEEERIAERERLLEEERLKQQKLQEERLVLQQQTEQLRKEATERLRQERFERAAAAAKPLIDDASAFVKADPTNPKVVDYVQQIADLNATLSRNDGEDTERRTLGLASALKHDPSFGKFQVERAHERERNNARFLADALKALGTQKTFLVRIATQDPTSANASKLLPFIKQADAALSTPDLDVVQPVIGKIDRAIQDAGLKSDFAAFRLREESNIPSPDAPQTRPDTAAEPHTVTSGEATLPRTEKNRFLRDGSLQDVVLMFNTSTQAPHVAKNLRGDVVFDGRADVCLFGHGSDDDTLGELVAEMMKAYATAKTIVLAGGICDADRLGSYDVVATRRGTFLRLDPRYALLLITAIETDAFKQLAVFTEEQIRSASAAEAVKATEIAADVDRGSKDGFGLLLLQTRSPAVCMVVSDRADAHHRLLLARSEKLSADMEDSPTFAATSIDVAFVNTKHGQCGAIYAEAKELRELANGLKRDGVAFRFSTVWFSPEDLSAADDRLPAEKSASGPDR